MLQVTEDGQIFVLRSSPAANTRTHDEEEEEEEEGEDRKRDGIHIKHKAHPPRYLSKHLPCASSLELVQLTQIKTELFPVGFYLNC